MKNKVDINVIITFLCIISLIVMLLTLISTSPTTVYQFDPPQFDTQALSEEPNVPDDLGWDVIDADVFRVGICGKVTLEQNAAVVWFTNPQDNHVWLKLRILDIEGNILGESGLITPGQYIKTVNLTTSPESETPITIKIMAYEPDTYHSAGSITLNTKIFTP